ncbi:MAG: hypothetical protein EKK49_00090 [Rhodocyclaceae bacterium]|nr:MAG: hypothetical protein EKK49_00090 [Rhodocyclaceae bacterium]
MTVVSIARFAPLQGAELDKFIELAQGLADQAEKLLRLQLESNLGFARDALAGSAGFLEVRDVAGLADWQARFFQPQLQRSSETARQQYEVLLEAGQLFAEAFRNTAATASGQVRHNIDRLAEGAPTGFDAWFDVLRGGFEAQMAAFENFGKIGEQIKDVALAVQVAKPAASSRREAARKTA